MHLSMRSAGNTMGTKGTLEWPLRLVVLLVRSRAQHFLQIYTHTQTTPISNNLCPPIAWHVPTNAHPCSSNCAHVFKICNVTNNIVPMPIHAHPWTIISHSCPPKTHGHGIWAPNVGLWWEGPCDLSVGDGPRHWDYLLFMEFKSHEGKAMSYV